MSRFTWSVCVMGLLAGTASAQVSTGFEAPFVPGPVEPQQGWTATGTNLPSLSISTANPFSGTQHLRLARNTAAANGAQHLVFTPNTVLTPGSDTSTTMMVNISDFNGADYDIAAQSPIAALISWRMKFSFANGAGTGPGNIFVLDDTAPGLPVTLNFVDTGVPWVVNAYTAVRVDMIPSLNRIDYYYGGTLIHQGILPGATVPDQLVFIHDNFQINDVMDVDDLNVSIPSPGALAVAGAGALAMARRRRR